MFSVGIVRAAGYISALGFASLVLDAATVQRYDRSRMIDRVASLPDQIRESFRSAKAVRLDARQARRVYVAGMGGSAIAGDAFASWAEPRSAREMFVVRDYALPPGTDKGDVLIAVSYSGNTEETLGVLEHARRLGLRVAAVTSGGTLGRVASDRGYALARVPPGIVPRAAFGHLFGALAALCEDWIKGDLDEEIGSACAHLQALRKGWAPGVSPEENRAKELAAGIGSRTPVVYAARPYGPVATRWQTQFNENAKALAWSSTFPEADHNEIVGWEGDEVAPKFVPIFLRDRDEAPPMRRRIDATRELLKDAGVVEVADEGGTLLSRILGTILLGDFASVYLACLRGHDPTEAPIIERLKERLAG